MNSTITNGLSYVDQLWLDSFQNSEYPIAKVTLTLFAWYQIVFIGRYIPYFVLDKFKLLQQYKLQPDKVFTDDEWWKCVKTITFDQYAYHLPMMIAFYPVAMFLGKELIDKNCAKL